VLPDTYPVDEHIRGKFTEGGIAGTRPANRKIEDRKHLVAPQIARTESDGAATDIGVRERFPLILMLLAHTMGLPIIAGLAIGG